MKIIDINIQNVPYNDQPISLCLGYFDGVHLGHRELIIQALNEGYPVAVLTFDNSPAYLLGQKSKKELTSIADKADIFESLGVSTFYLMHFDETTLNVTKDEFIKTVLAKINPKKIFCGEDYRFGTRGEGNPLYLSRFFDVGVVKTMCIDGTKISSSIIKDLISEGKVNKASQFLGRPYRMGGMIVEGNHIGRTMQFPTANLDLDADYVAPINGVYVGYTYIGYEKYKSVICVSTHPTVYELADPIIEVHIIDFDENIYGTTIFVDFIDYVRDIRKFDNLDDLREQLLKDKEIAKKVLQ